MQIKISGLNNLTKFSLSEFIKSGDKEYYNKSSGKDNACAMDGCIRHDKTKKSSTGCSFCLVPAVGLEPT